MLPFGILVTKLDGDAFGLEPSWLLMNRYALRKPAAIRAMLKSIFNTKATQKVEELTTMPKNPSFEDIKTVIMMEFCTLERRAHLDFNAQGIDFKDLRELCQIWNANGDEIGNYAGETHENSCD